MSEMANIAGEVQENSEVLNLRVSPTLVAVEPGPERLGSRNPTIFFLFVDLSLVLVSAYLATYSRWWLATANGNSLSEISNGRHLSFAVLYAGLVILSCLAYHVYSTNELRAARQEQLALLKAVGTATLLVAAFIYLSGIKTISRVVVAETVVFSTIAMTGWRFWRWKRVLDGLDCRNVLIVGAGAVERDLERHFSQNPWLGFAVKGYLDRREDSTRAHYPERRSHRNDLRMLGSVRDLARVARSNFVDELFITTPENRELVKRLIFDARCSGIDARVIPDLYDGLGSKAPIEYLGHVPIMSFCHQSVPTVGLLIKRCIDMIVAIIALIVLLPILLVTALVVKFSSPGPILYRSTRVGKKGRDFICYKFRTMVANAEQLRDSLHHLNEREDILFKITNDPRITPIGRFLRKYSIDELPQFLNVLRGDMSLVGPRPPVPSEYRQYALEHLRRLDVVPGITGLWQVAARTDPSFHSYIALDLQYVDNWTVWLDCKILVRTIAVVFAGTGQ